MPKCLFVSKRGGKGGQNASEQYDENLFWQTLVYGVVDMIMCMEALHALVGICVYEKRQASQWERERLLIGEVVL